MPTNIPPEIAAAAIAHRSANQKQCPATSKPGRQYIPRPARLTDQQEATILHLTEGKSIAAAARMAGVNRGTIYRWITNDPEFQAAFNAWQHELRTSTRARLLALCDIAVDSLANGVINQDPRLAVSLLKGMGMISADEPGSANVDELAKRQDLEERTRKMELATEEQTVKMGEDLADIPELIRQLQAERLAQAAASAAPQSAPAIKPGRAGDMPRHARASEPQAEKLGPDHGPAARYKHPYARTAKAGNDKGSGAKQATDDAPVTDPPGQRSNVQEDGSAGR